MDNNIYQPGIDILGIYDSVKGAAPAPTGDAVDRDVIAKARKKLDDFKGKKALLDRRIVDNEEWFRLKHWRNGTERDIKRNTGWLFSAIDNKHADYLDNFPEVHVLPREQSDEQAAADLNAVIPVILKRNGFKAVYSATAYDKLKFGTGIQHVFWDTSLENGLGDVAIERVDPLNIFWEPGIEDIQDSSDIFLVELWDNEAILAAFGDQFPELQTKLGSTPGAFTTAQYTYPGNVDYAEKSYIINWYYKKMARGRCVLHFCRFVGDVILYSSENDPTYSERGWYDHGKYPFVFDTLFPEAGSPFGYGEIDVNRDTQEDIDEMNALLLRNSKQALTRRYFLRNSAGVNEEEYADFGKDFVHVASMTDDTAIREINPTPVSATYVEVLNNKVQELKEVSGTRDVTAGGTGGSVTAASAIAALQETGGKTSRAMIAKSYEAFSDVCALVIELIRQFYDAPRSFRILGDNGETQYKQFDNSALLGGVQQDAFGVSFATKQPVFDLDVKAYKQNPWSKAAQNQDVINFYQLGFFNPANDVQTLAAMEMLEFENKDKVKAIIEQNGQQFRMIHQVLPMLLSYYSAINYNEAAMIAQEFGIEFRAMPPELPPEEGEQSESVPEKTDEQKKRPLAKTDSVGQQTAEAHPLVKAAADRAAASTAAR